MSNRCDDNVFENGHSVIVLDACMHRAEVFVQEVAMRSGQAVDWHYSGGRVNVLYVGDHTAVDKAIDECLPVLTDSMKRQRGECGSCSDPIRHQPGSVLRRYGPDAHGPYRAGDPLPDDVIAVVP